jgi:hypothetical protein
MNDSPGFESVWGAFEVHTLGQKHSGLFSSFWMLLHPPGKKGG